MNKHDVKAMRSALENLADSASNFVEDPVWIYSLAIDLREAAYVLGDDKLYEKMDNLLNNKDEEND